MLKNVAIITGQSTTGKTKAVTLLLENPDIEVINCDRFSFYKNSSAGRDVKPLVERDAVSQRAHFYSILEPNENTWNPSHYLQEVERLIPEIVSRGHTPLIEGFSGGYLRALLDANKQEGKSITYSPLFYISYQRGTNLVALFEKRVEKFISEGALEEARYLHERYPNCFNIEQSSIYKPLIRYLQGERTLEQAKGDIIDDSLLVLAVQAQFVEQNPGFILIEGSEMMPEKIAETVSHFLQEFDATGEISVDRKEQDAIFQSQVEIFKEALKMRGLLSVQGLEQIKERLRNLPANKNPETSFFTQDFKRVTELFFSDIEHKNELSLPSLPMR